MRLYRRRKGNSVDSLRRTKFILYFWLQSLSLVSFREFEVGIKAFDVVRIWVIRATALILLLTIAFLGKEAFAQQATIGFTYSGSDTTGVGGSVAGVGSFSIPISSNSTVGIGSSFQYNFIASINQGGVSTFNYGLGDLTNFSLKFSSAPSLSLSTQPVAASNPNFLPESFATNSGIGQTFNSYGSQTSAGSVTLNQASVFNAVMQNSVHVTAGGPSSLTAQPTSITATFTPKFGLTQQQAAALGGFSGFNWVQTVTWPTPSHIFSVLSPTVPLTNFTDPPPGGYVGQLPYPNASNPFYYNNVIDSSNVWSITNHTQGNTLDFYDRPQNPYLPIGEREIFTTDLVGTLNVPNGTIYQPLVQFTWTSDFTPVLFGQGYGGVMTDSLPGQGADTGTGGVKILSETYFGPDVPEISTWLMVLLGFAGIVTLKGLLRPISAGVARRFFEQDCRVRVSVQSLCSR